MEDTMKTVLAPNAPWPTYTPEGEVVKPKPVAKKRVPPPPKDPSKIAHTSKKFDEWADKNLARKFK
jgi:hypothetical protein